MSSSCLNNKRLGVSKYQKKKKKKLQFRHFYPTFCPKASEAKKWEVRKNKFMVNINEKKYDEEQTTVRTENTVRISNSY